MNPEAGCCRLHMIGPTERERPAFPQYALGRPGCEPPDPVKLRARGHARERDLRSLPSVFVFPLLAFVISNAAVIGLMMVFVPIP